MQTLCLEGISRVTGCVNQFVVKSNHDKTSEFSGITVYAIKYGDSRDLTQTSLVRLLKAHLTDAIEKNVKSLRELHRFWGGKGSIVNELIGDTRLREDTSRYRNAKIAIDSTSKQICAIQEYLEVLKGQPSLTFDATSTREMEVIEVELKGMQKRVGRAHDRHDMQAMEDADGI